MERVLDQLRAEYAAKDRLPHFEVLKHFLAGSPQRAGYAEAARALGISETTAKVAAHRMRKRYRELLRAEIAQTVERPEDVDDEIRDLFAVLGTCAGVFDPGCGSIAASKRPATAVAEKSKSVVTIREIS